MKTTRTLPATRLLALALAGLTPFPIYAQALATPAATAPAPLPEKIARFEQMLVRSPGPGRAFDEVFTHYFSTEGVAVLRQRWTAARLAAPAGPNASAYGLLLGQLAERIGESDTARAAYLEAASTAPTDYRPLHRLGRLEIREGKLPAGIASLEKAMVLDMGPADAQDVLRDLARARSRAFDEAGALTAWKNLATRFPDDALVLEEVGQAQLDAAAYDEAAITFTALEKASAGDAYRAVLARLRLGEVAAKKGDKDAALGRFSAALDGTHRDSWLHREALARVNALFRERGDFDGLIAFHEARLQGASRDPAAARRLAELLLELDRTDNALAWFDKATGWSPDDHELRFAHIRALIAAKKGDDALPRLRELVKRQPKEAAYGEALGQLYWDRAKAATEPAAATAERTLALEAWAALAPKTASVTELLALAEIYRSHALDEETRATLARALAAEPASYDLRERLALQLLAMKRDDEAWTTARGGKNGLADASQYRRLATLEKRQGLLDAALVSIDRGLALSPENYELLDLRWQVLAELTRWDDAIALLPKLLAKAPGDFAIETIETRHVQALRSAEKLDAALAALATRVAAEDPTLTEADHRLHLRLSLTQTLAADTDAAFAAARKRFPDSFSISQLEADYRERTSPLAERVATIRRLAVLRPERSAEWLRRLVNVYRYDADMDGARKVISELITLAPADAQNHVLAAELEFDAGAPAAGVTALQRALRLASDPAPVRARLARAHLEQNRPAAALEIYEEAYYSAADDNARRALLVPMTESAVAASDIDGLLARFVERNRPRRETAEYHSDLGEICFNAQDWARAQDAWNRALELKRDNPRLIARLVELARKNGDAIAVTRLLRLRNELAPSHVNAIELGEALLESDSAPEAVELFLAHASYFYSDTTLLPRVLPALAARDLADPLIERLRTEAASAADPSDRDFVLATAFLAIRDFPRAEKLLWAVYERPPAPVARPAAVPAAPANSVPTPPVSAAQLAMMSGYQSVQTTQQGYQAATQLLQDQSGGSYYRRNRSMSFGNQNLSPSTTESQDTALGYLGALAVRQNKAEEFLTRLEASLETRHVPASSRLLEFSKVQARDAALRYFDAALAEPAPNLPGLLVAQNLLPEPYDQNTGQRAEASPELQKKIDALQAVITKLNPPASEFQRRMQQFGEFQQKKDYEGAFALLAEVQALPNLSPNESRQLGQIKLHLLMQTKRWDEFIPTLREMIASEPFFYGDQVTYLFGAYFSQDEGQAKISETEMDMLAGLLLEAYAKPAPVAAQAQMQAMRRYRVQSSAQQNLDMILSYGAMFAGIIPGQDHQLQQLVSQLDQKKREAFVARLLAVGAKRNAADLLQARTLVLRIALIAGDTKQAESIGAEILASNPDPALLFNLGDLAYRDNRLDVATTRYEAIPASAGPIAIAASARLLEIALLGKNIEVSKAAATRLVKLRPPGNLPNLNLAEILRELGLDQTIKLPAPPTRASISVRRDRNEELNRLSNELQEALNKKDTATAEGIARRMLASSSIADARKGNDWGRRRALEGFIRTGLMDSYIADLDAQLARSPGSPLVIELLAEAHGVIRQQSNSSSGRMLSPVASSPAPLALPLRLRLSRKGDTLTASYALVPAPAPVVPAAATTDAIGTPAPVVVEPPVPTPAPEWVELGSVTLPDLGQPLPGLTGRTQNFRNVAEGRFTSITFDGRSLAPADFKKRETLRVGENSSVFHAFDAPFADGVTAEITLDVAATAKARVPVSRGLLLRDSADQQPRVALLLAEDGTLALTARRHTGRRDLDYLAKLVALRPRDEQLRGRYVESLFNQNQADEAVAFLSRPENEDLLPRFTSNDTLINFHRKAGTLPAFAALVADRAAAKANRPGQYPQVDYNVLEFARRLRKSKDTASALVVWEKALPLVIDHQSAEVRGELADILLATNTPESRARAIEIIRDQFIRPAAPAATPAPIFRDSMYRNYSSPWYTNTNTGSSRIYTNAVSLLDGIDDLAIVRSLIAENTPRLASPNAGWEPLCYDLALKIRAGDPSAPAVFAALWSTALDAQKNPADQNTGRRSQQNPLNGFLPACLGRFVSWPDPDKKIEGVFRSLLDQFPKNRGLNRNYFNSNPSSAFANNPWLELPLRLTWSDYLLAHGDTAGYRQSLLDLAEVLARQDSRQVNTSVITQLFGRLIAIGAVAEAREFHDTTLHRASLRQGYRNANNPRSRHFNAMLDALEGKGTAPAPALAAWIVPMSDGGAELRWEITGRLETDKEENREAQPRLFGQSLPSMTDGTYDLSVEFVTPGDKAEIVGNLDLPAIAARGRHRLENVPPATLFRAKLQPRAGGDAIPLAPQAFSIQPNLIENPEAHINKITTRETPIQTPGWSLPIPAFIHAGGPAVNGNATSFSIPAGNNNRERLSRTESIPIDPKQAYLISTWASLLPDEYSQLGIEFLDAAGNTVGNSNSHGIQNEDLRWQRITISFGPNSRKGLPNRNNIPDKAVAMRLWIGGQSGLRLADLAIQRIPEPPAPPAPVPVTAPAVPAPAAAPTLKPPSPPAQK